MRSFCPLCESSRLTTVLGLAGVPVHQNLLASTAAEAIACRRGAIDLVLCRSCGFVFNASFDETLPIYSSDYENSQAHSTAFQSYLDSLVAGLIVRHGLRGRTVVEIGCGKGEFLSRLCTAAGCRGIGFDPSYVAARDPVASGVSIIPQLYSATHRQAFGDLVCARHVIEHIPRPTDLLHTVRGALGGRSAALFFETPRFEWIIEQRAFWDIFYEHCSYFAMPVLARLFEGAGFAVLASRSTFGDQYQWIEARPAARSTPVRAGSTDGVRQWADRIQGFADAWAEQRGFWRRQTEALARRGRCAVWGAGAKGVTFLNVLGLDGATVPVVVDINPRKQGKYVPGTGQPVVAPAALGDHAIKNVLVMNPYYVDEVRAALDALGLRPDLIPLGGTPAAPA